MTLKPNKSELIFSFVLLSSLTKDESKRPKYKELLVSWTGNLKTAGQPTHQIVVVMYFLYK